MRPTLALVSICALLSPLSQYAPYSRPCLNRRCNTGPCITNVIATCRKNFSQWERSFLWKLRCHWLEFLRRVAKTVSNTGPRCLASSVYKKHKLSCFQFNPASCIYIDRLQWNVENRAVRHTRVGLVRVQFLPLHWVLIQYEDVTLRT